MIIRTGRTSIWRSFWKRAFRSTLRDPARWMIDWLGGAKSESGIDVNEFKAMNYTAVFACVRVLSESVGSIPWLVYEKLQPRGRERAQNHPLYNLLKNEPNDFMTSDSTSIHWEN
ncbi:hypothetical protein LCGC14_2453230, partial [marine sediment metagenome]